MLSLFALRPLHIQSPSTSHQPYSPPHKHTTTFSVPFSGTTNSQTVRVTSASPTTPPTPDIRRLFSPKPSPTCGIGNDTGKNAPANSDMSPDLLPSKSGLALTTYPNTSIFPVVGPFDLLYCVQTGAFAAAWAAKDHRTGRIMCLKAFRSLREPGVARCVQTELKLFRRIVKSKAGERGKQFIMELNRSFQHGINVFFAMELMATDLGMYLCIEPERCKLHARRWMAQLALGIHSLHEMGILHRDIKSENILIDSRENVRIIDFGLAHLSPTGKPLRHDTECAIDFLGSPPYMAPEVLRNKGIPVRRRKFYGIAVDWWALGCILFELESLDHQVLFDTDKDVYAYIAWTQRTSQLEEKYRRFEGLEPVVVSLLEGLLQIHPSDRYSLSDMEKHDYFLHHNRSVPPESNKGTGCRFPANTSEFDNAAARALERPIRPELVPHFTGEDEAMLTIKAAELSSVYDWTNLKWARLYCG